ncbi:hypothetical protein ONE63_009859 [Megalurothrips usitatus]|uniref:Carboxylesterase type B domain-containing protein n=1 Tax=Megalurothrips usitatus TaxID=439358 RepID=A0AAV7XKA4_9NEOP|nr:hypothetical protein ONE63_009859 [Megalurothrips usitatus]
MRSSRLLVLLLAAAAVVAPLAARADEDVDDDAEAEVAAEEEEAEELVASTTPSPAAPTKTRAPVVETQAGRISGKVLTSAGGRQYFAYLGVPYAQPPVGDLRFKFPRRLKEGAWEGVRRCDTNPSKCPQISYPERRYEGDEDCLYLNVYTHRVEDISQPVDDLVKRLRPVLVWLHGGNFQHGSGTFDDVGPERFMDNEEDIVLVVPNYRLNALGFFSVGENAAVGNAGMKDVFTVLSWVHGHIAAFGGHPAKTTLGGHQAGAAAAHLHALSPLSSGEPDLFLQTFSMSGSALAPWAVLPTAEATRRALKLGRVLGCAKAKVPDDKVNRDDLVRCLRTKPAEDIVRASEKVLDWASDLSFPFVPSVEKFDGHNRPFMIADPEEVLRGGMGTRKTWVTGTTTHDGLPQALQMMVFRGLMRELDERFQDTVWDYLGMSHVVDVADPEWRRAAGQRLRDHYLPGNQSIALGTLSGLIDLSSDALYYYSMRKAVVLQSSVEKGAPVLVYQFGFDRHKDRTRVLGVPLGTDVELMFPAVFAEEKSKLTTGEERVSKRMLKLLTNFVAYEDPTPQKEELLENFEWPAAKGGNFSFLDVSLKGKFSEAKSDIYLERMALWEQIFEELKSYQSEGGKTRKIKRDEL